MEGDSMVAIVQGLRDAGLAVTLMNSSHLQNSLNPRAVPICKSSVEASTNVERFGRSTAAHAHDDHYTSSYQLAHCNARPSSPPERLPEFPPQRLEQSRNQGNFQMGGFNSESTYSPAPPPPAQTTGGQYRRGTLWPDRGPVSGRLSPSSVPSQSTDPFVHSLRRYPLPVSPERSVSSELVQRLLSYTQNKHLSRASNRSGRSLDESPTRDQKTTTSTKNIQTYTRTKKQSTRDCGANTHNDIRFGFGKKGRSMTTSPYYVRPKTQHHNDSYDYLKSNSRRGRCPEVRYLDDVKKCIRDTIKQIYDDKPVACPQIMRRYSHHKKEHHQNSHDSIPTCSKHQSCCPCEAPVTSAYPPDFSQESAPTPDISSPKDKTEGTICACKAKTKSNDNTTVSEIFQWLKSLPVYADDSPQNKKKREEMVQDLADKINGLERDEDFELKAKDEIKKCIEKLPMWYPGAKRDIEMFKNQIADDLFSRLTAVVEGADDLKDTISQWVEKIEFEKDAKVDKDDIVERLINRLKPLVNSPDKMKSEIKNILEDLPVVNKRKVINKLADKLTDDLELEIPDKITTDKRISTNLTTAELEKQIMEWLDDVPELFDDIKENTMIIKILAKKLKRIQEKSSNDVENQEQMKEEVVDWVEEILKSRGYKLDSKTKDEISNKLIDKLVSAAKFESQGQGRKSSLEEQIAYEDQVSEWLDDIVDIPEEDKQSHQKLVKRFATKLQELQSENADDKIIEEEIIDFLNSLPREEVTVKDKEKLAKKLIEIISISQTRKSFNQDEELQQSVLSEIAELVEDIPSKISKSKRKEIKDKVTDVLAKNINHLSDKTDNINQEIVNILKEEAKMAENEATDLASAIVNRVKGMPLLDKSESSVFGVHMKTDNDIKQLVSDEVCDILNDFHISARKKKDLEKSITKVLADQIIRGTDNKKTKDNIISILQDANVSEDDAINISNRLLERNNELSLSCKTRDSTLGINKYRLSRARPMSPAERDEFEKRAEREIIDFIEDVTGDDSFQTRKKGKEAAGHLVHRLGEIVTNPDDTDKEKSIFQEVSQYLEKLSLDGDGMSREEMAKQLSNRLQSVGFQASTPNKDQYSFYPKRGSIEISSIHLDEDDFTKNNIKSAQDISDEEKKFVQDLIQLIHSWIDELSINLSKSFKETMAQDLASDIVDRQKYIQINPEAKTSHEEELEHLKYQLFRWLHKLPDIDDLSSVMQKTETLRTKIKELNVPELVKPTRKHTRLKSGKDLIRDSMESIRDEISTWMEEIPQDLYTTTDKDFLKQMVHELAEKIQQFRVKNQSEHICSEISNWLSKLIKEVDQQKLTQMTNALEARLKQKGLTEASVMQDQDSNQFENISDRQEPVHNYLKEKLDEWIYSLPIARIDSAEMLQFEILKKEFMDNLMKIRQENALNEQKMKDEIRSYLLRFPIEENMKQDMKFISDKVEQLFKNLLTVPFETGLEQRSDRFIKKAVFDWLKSLPLDKTKTVSDISGNAIDDLISAISNLIVKTDVVPIGEIKKTLEDATESFLKSVPLDPNTDINVKSLAEALFKNVKEISRKRSSVTKPPTMKKAADILFDNIGNWVDDLPLKEDTPEEVEKAKLTKQEIASKLIHKIGELNMNPEVFHDDFLYENMLEDEIDDLLTDLSSEDVKNNLPIIKKDLMEKVKEARQKTQEEVAGKAYKQQLREAISKTLPSEPLTAEEQATFEVLKDNLADAFITLHYAGDDEELKTKYKTKINEEVSKFCNDYLKKHPATPIDSKKLNQDLYNALKGVPIPKEETVRNEVELVKIKDEVNDWIKELPLTEQTAAEKAQTTKIVAVLAKKLHDIEKQKELSPDSDYDNKMRKEITKWLKKLPLEIDDKKAFELTEKLIDNLKNTDQSRRVSASTRHSIEPDVFDVTLETPASLDNTLKSPKTCKTDIHKARYTVPPSSLSIEDQQHLQNIRERSQMPRSRYLSKDASVSPLPMDAGSQTEVSQPQQNQPVRGKRLSQQSSGVQTTRPPEDKSMQAVGSQAEVTPHVIVKEYYWDAAKAAKMGVCATCPQYSPINNKSTGVCSPCPSQFATPRHTPQMKDRTLQSSQGTCSQCPLSPQTSPYEQTPTLPRNARREFDQPCFRRGQEATEDQEGTSRSFRSPRVTRLGSFDDIETRDWSKFPEEFWGKRSDDDEFVKERKRDEEKVTCRCRERILTKCSGKRGKGCSPCQSGGVRMCAKCCGVHCPYPSYLYFRK